MDAVEAIETLEKLITSTHAGELPRLLGDLERLKALAFARLASSATAPTPDESAAVGIDDAARILGMRRSTLYRKWRALGIGYRDSDGHVKFTRAALRRYLARKGG